MAATMRRLGPVDVAGGLWGADLLAALADDRTKLPAETVAPASYGLPARASTEQAARASWTVLTAAWEEFNELHTARVERDGTDRYGDDRFTHDTWLVHLLDQLGFQPSNTPPGGLAVDRDDADDGEVDRYSITHLHADQVPLLLLDAGVPLDTRTRGVIGAHAQSPHSLVQDFLNRTSRHLWAIVTNGLTLRILRDNAALSRQAYIEFDLAAIFDDGAYADFALLWHASHATRFAHDPDSAPSGCIAERWQEHATATGVAALEDLRDGVEAAIAEIGQGLVEHRDNTVLRAALDDPDDPLDAAALYRELLYVAYRHVFWFTLDDRDLLHPADADRAKVALYRDHYASTVLRGKARAHLGADHPDGWQHFRTIAGWFADPDGQPALDLPGLLGRLWEPDATAHVAGATLTNRRYYEAVRRLAYVTRDGTLQRINYDAMGSEELGAVYESLLEIRPTVDTTQRKFTLGRAAGSERKKTGSYYTPTSLIKVLLDEALDPVLDERIRQAVHDLPADASPDQRREAQEQAVLTTTVCDPAMGSAHFLVGAGMRIAKRLAQLRTEEVEPSPEAIQHAFRDVASRCLYGVDVNPMAVELAKVAIWLECHVPGQPLTFLDHHLKAGNALLGVGFDPDLIAWHRTAKKAADQKGVPDAAFKALAGDDKTHARLLRDRNKQRRGGGGQLRLGAGTHHDRLDRLADRARQLDELPDDSPEALAAKQQAFEGAQRDAELQRQRLRADAWMAAWTFPKTKDASAPLTSDDPLAHDELPWDIYYDTFLDHDLQLDRPGVHSVRDESRRLAFFHWHLEFPEIAAAGGFGLSLGNPPWEQLQVKSREFFSQHGRDDIAHADSAALRKALVRQLRASDDPVDQMLVQAYDTAIRDADAAANFTKSSGRFSIGAVGAADTAPLFADHFFHALAGHGRSGIVVPTKLLTDSTYEQMSNFFADGRMTLAAEFINTRKRFFPDNDSRLRFAVLVLCGDHDPSRPTRFAFALDDPERLDEVSFPVDQQVRRLVNPLTETPPPFLDRASKDLVVHLYSVGQAVADVERSWQLKIGKAVGQSSDSEFFVKDSESGGRDDLVPVYESKFIDTFDYREKCYSEVPEEQRYVSRAVAKPFRHREDPDREVTPRNWFPRRLAEQRVASVVDDASVLLVWANVTSATNARTVRPALMPRYGPNDSLHLVGAADERKLVLLCGAMASFAYDFIARNKLSGTNFTQTVWRQTLLPNESAFASPLAGIVQERAAALSAPSAVMAKALGYAEAVRWDDGQRVVWRTELEAAMFHLYGYAREDVAFVMDTFPIVARRDRQTEGLADDDPNWRTKRLILAKYDELAEHTRAGTTYVSPDPPPPLPDKLRLSEASGVGGA